MTEREYRRRRLAVQKSHHVERARDELMRALEVTILVRSGTASDAAGDEHLLRALVDLVRWRQAITKEFVKEPEPKDAIA